MTRSGTGADPIAERLAAALARAGTDRAFGVPGGGPNLALIEALADQGIDFVLGHGETATCIMASTYAHLTGRPAVAVVTRGPGAASAVNGAAQATLDRQPLILVTDTVPDVTADRVAHQRIDQRAMLAPVTRCSATVTAATTSSALDHLIARSLGPPAGAVHLDIDPSGPQDAVTAGAEPTPSSAIDVDPVVARVGQAHHPLVIVGLGALDQSAALRSALERFGAPVLQTYQAIGVLPTDHPLSAGLFTNGASEAPLLAQADLVVTVGLDPVEPIPAPWTPSATVISLATHPTTDRYLPIAHELIGQTGELAERVLVGDHRWEPDAGSSHRRRVQVALAGEGGASSDAGSGSGPLTPVGLVTALAQAAPDELTTTVDAGAHFLAVMPFWPVRRPGDLLISNGLATMGYSLPAAIGAALARPDRPVLCLVGDGGLGMTAAELETVARLGLPVTVVVFNDSALSLIRIKQGPGGGGGAAAVGYRETDFAALARSFGMAGTRVDRRDELVAAVGALRGAPALIDARIDPSSYPHLLQVTRG